MQLAGVTTEKVPTNALDLPQKPAGQGSPRWSKPAEEVARRKLLKSKFWWLRRHFGKIEKENNKSKTPYCCFTVFFGVVNLEGYMARTESTSIQAHPKDEQNQINLMQKFHWNLIGSQEIKTIDNHLEKRGDDLYQVTSSEHYVKLTFSRDLDTPNLNEVKKLENEYFSIKAPKYPSMFPGSFILWGILALIYGAGIVLWILYFFLFYSKNKAAADELALQGQTRKKEIMDTLSKFD